MAIEAVNSIEVAESVRVAAGVGPRDLPVNLQRVTDHLGLKVYYNQFEDPRISGMLITDAARVPIGVAPGEQGTVFLKAGEYTPRSRFTLAHEVGHFCLGHGNGGVVTDFFRGRTDGNNDPKETEANEFAAELLMPRVMFTELWVSGLPLEELTVIFGVSLEAAIVRARTLNLREPAY